MSGLSLAESDSNASRTFKTLYIPADESKPIEEWDIKYNNATEVSCLMDKLKPHFANRGFEGKDRETLRESVRKQVAETMKKQNPSAPVKPVDDAMVDMILGMSAVDCVALQNNKFSTGYVGLMMYVDDQGKAKGLPQNMRATRATFECGVPTQVLGDTLIARNFDDEQNFRRIDFGLREFNEDPKWKEDAKKANAEKGQSANDEKTKQLQELLARTQTQMSAAAPAPVVKVCSYAGCDNTGTLRCSRCKRSWYCAVECQKKDWKFHKTNICSSVPAPTEAEAQLKAVEAAAQH